MPRVKFSGVGCGAGSPRIPILKFILHSDEQNPKMVPFIEHCIYNGSGDGRKKEARLYYFLSNDTGHN